MALTNSYIKRPCTWIIFFYIFAIVITGLTFGLGFFDIEPVQERDFLVWDDPTVKNNDKQSLAIEFVESNSGKVEKTERTQNVVYWNMAVVFQDLENLNYGLIDKKNLKKIQKISEWVLKHPKWKTVCLAKSIYDKTCSDESSLSPLSILQAVGLNIDNLDDVSQQEISFFFKRAIETP